MIHGRAIFWFKRDLRADDNTGLINAVRDSGEVIPIYVLEDSFLSGYRGESKRLGFFVDALSNLEAELKKLGSYLLVLRGKAEEIIPALIESQKAEAVYTNRAYGFSGVKRDLGVEHQCRLMGAVFRKFDDTFLVPPHEVDQRKVFTPFYSIWNGKRKDPPVDMPAANNSPALKTGTAEYMTRDLGRAENKYWPPDFPLTRLRDFNFRDYGATRDFPHLDGTSRLSPYLRFGVVSVRRVFEAATAACPEPNPYVSELAWREFWYHVMHNFPSRGPSNSRKRGGT